ncbi:MAG: hypothetical protein ACRDHB_01060 [Actinomycetota bacterium]
MLRDLRKELDRLRRDDPPFTRNTDNLPRKDVHWVEPRLVAQIGFAEWIRDGRMRHLGSSASAGTRTPGRSSGSVPRRDRVTEPVPATTPGAVPSLPCSRGRP